MDAINYFRLANEAGSRPPESFSARVKLHLMTNFTDGVLQKILSGMCVGEDIFPEIYAMPYKQYHFDLKNPESDIYRMGAAATCVLFDASHIKQNEFISDPKHFDDVLADLRAYSASVSGMVFINTCLLPYRTPYGNLFREDPLYAAVERYNEALRQVAHELGNVHVLETNRIAQEIGEMNVRDPRSHYAYDAPFTHAFAVALCREWMALIRALLGKTKKCIVLDLDNTLWGGIVGEAGAIGIQLGPEYPGNVFVNFQHALRGLYERGVMLAINSRNNPADAMEVIERHPHMVLREKHFSAICINWNDKATNLRAIAEELNIGLDSLVFFDDDPMNRELVRTQMPEVLVPEFSLPPEEYARALLSLDAFTQLQLTAEDRERGRMYSEERQRKLVRTSTQNLDEYIAQLGIRVDVRFNDEATLARAAQLTQKTNQFNLTTRRYADSEIQRFVADGGLVCTGDVTDKFGAYGTTNVAIVRRVGEGSAELDTFLMSCRVIGRGVEQLFLDQILTRLASEGVGTVTAWYIPTAKNEPCRDFLPHAGFQLVREREDGAREYLRTI